MPTQTLQVAGSMACSPSKTEPLKQLKAILQEQQERFKLDIYLSERRYGKRGFGSEGNNSRRNINSAKNLRRSSNIDLIKIGNGIPYASRILISSVVNKLVSMYGSQKPSSCNCTANNVHVSETIGKTQQTAGNELSSASRVTLFELFSKKDVEEDSPSSEQNHGSFSAGTSQALTLTNLKEPRDTKLKWGCMVYKKQLGLGSDIKEKPSNEDATVQGFQITRQKETASTSSLNLPKKATKDYIFSSSFWELLLRSLTEKQNFVGIKLQEIIGPGSSQFLRTKRVSQQTKQLIFDCINEAIEACGRNDKIWKYTHELMRSEELGQVICEHICSWSNQSGDVTSITQLMHSAFQSTTEEWSDFQLLNKEIGIEIGSAIMDELVTEMIDLLSQ